MSRDVDLKNVAGSRNDNDKALFDLSVKRRALKILIDYRDRSGRKWHRICNEILDLANVKPTLQATLLNRQDLERWASGASTLGDEKFKLVIDFLTHPLTVKRPEFSACTDLMGESQRVLRVGRALVEFYDSSKNQLDGSSRHSHALFDGIRRDLPGLRRFERNGKDHFLSIQEVPGEHFMIAHLLISRTEATSEEYVFTRRSGFITFGDPWMLHLRDIVFGTSFNSFVQPQILEYSTKSEVLMKPGLARTGDDFSYLAFELNISSALLDVSKPRGPIIGDVELDINILNMKKIKIRWGKVLRSIVPGKLSSGDIIHNIIDEIDWGMLL